MSIILEKALSNAKVSILQIEGDLDASNYQDLIDTGKHALEDGAKYLLIDMTKMPFMSSSGLVALHSIALIMRGDDPPDPEYGWEAFRMLDRDRDSGIQERVKLLNPNPKIERSLEITGMNDFFEIHHNLETAIGSFE